MELITLSSELGIWPLMMKLCRDLWLSFTTWPEGSSTSRPLFFFLKSAAELVFFGMLLRAGIGPPGDQPVSELLRGDRGDRLVLDEVVQLQVAALLDVAEAGAGGLGDEELRVGHGAVEAAVRLAAVDHAVEVATGVGDRLALDLEVRSLVERTLGVGLDLVGRGAG